MNEKTADNSIVSSNVIIRKNYNPEINVEITDEGTINMSSDDNAVSTMAFSLINAYGQVKYINNQMKENKLYRSGFTKFQQQAYKNAESVLKTLKDQYLRETYREIIQTNGGEKFAAQADATMTIEKPVKGAESIPEEQLAEHKPAKIGKDPIGGVELTKETPNTPGPDKEVSDIHL